MDTNSNKTQAWRCILYSLLHTNTQYLVRQDSISITLAPTRTDPHRPDPTRPSPLVHDPISRICFFSLSLMRVSFSGISPLESASQYFLRYAGQWRLSAEHTVTRWFQLSIPRSNNVNGELHMFSGQCFV